MDRKVIIDATLLSMKVSGGATILASLVGVPLGAFMALRDFPGRQVLRTVLWGLTGLPPVVAGLVIYFLLSRSGPLGPLGLLYTPTAMLIAQFVLVLPIITSLTDSAVAAVPYDAYEAARALGANRLQVHLTVLKEAAAGALAAIMTGFGRAMAEVGAVMLVGGNITGRTRVMTTAIVLETRQGNFGNALWLGAILVALSVLLNGLARSLSARLDRREGGGR